MAPLYFYEIDSYAILFTNRYKNLEVRLMKRKSVVFLLIVLLLWTFAGYNEYVLGETTPIKLNSFPYEITCIFQYQNNIFVGTKLGFFVSNDSGNSFYERDKGLADLEITGVAFLKGKIFLGTANAGLYVSEDMGKTWISLMDKLNCPTISSIEINGSRIFVTSLCTGFHYSDDLGKTWYERNGGLPTLRTTTFIETPNGRCFLGTDQYGLFYSDTLGKTCSWDKFFDKYTITSLSYIGNNLIIGTNSGIFIGDIKNDHFKKLNFIGGNPYIIAMCRVNGMVLVAVKDFGVFVTSDGKTFLNINIDSFDEVSDIYFNKESEQLYVGTFEGDLWKLDLSKPFLVSDETVNLGSVVKGSALKGSLSIINLGASNLMGTIDSPYFIKFKNNEINGTCNLSFTVETTSLSVGEYTEPIYLKTNGGSITTYISFKVEKPSAIIIKLKIGSNTAYINGKKLYLDAPPFINSKAGRTLVPIRFISEAFGADVEWDPVERKVTIKMNPTENHGAKLIELWIGKKTVSVNLQKEKIDVAPVIVPPGRTMVPLRFIAETFGSEVKWDPVNRTITIIYTP